MKFRAVADRRVDCGWEEARRQIDDLEFRAAADGCVDCGCVVSSVGAVPPEGSGRGLTGVSIAGGGLGVWCGGGCSGGSSVVRCVAVWCCVC